MPKEKKKPHYLCVNPTSRTRRSGPEIMRGRPTRCSKAPPSRRTRSRRSRVHLHSPAIHRAWTIMERALASECRGRIRHHQDSPASRAGASSRRRDRADEFDRGEARQSAHQSRRSRGGGLFGLPTTINNVETLAARAAHPQAAPPVKGCVSRIQEHGTKLFSVWATCSAGQLRSHEGFPLKDLPV